MRFTPNFEENAIPCITVETEMGELAPGIGASMLGRGSRELQRNVAGAAGRLPLRRLTIPAGLHGRHGDCGPPAYSHAPGDRPVEPARRCWCLEGCTFL